MLIIIIVILVVVAFRQFMQQPQFGKVATIGASHNYRNGKFENLHYTPQLKEGVSGFTVLKDFFFGKSKRSKPKSVLPSVKTNLFKLDPDRNVIVWFGHSSYFMQVDGKKVLVDPVFSGNASPLKFTTKSFAGSDVYTVEDIPETDYLFITHDHYDHLDYETIKKLQPKIKQVITGLGVGAHLQHWGYNKKDIIEKNWNEEVILEEGFIVNTTSARHFSGRKFARNTSLWSSFVLMTPTMKIFIGGDSGYDSHLRDIGDKYGPFDLAILECGQYNEYWKYIHMMPEEVVQAAIDLKAEKLMPVHWSKFSLALHAWDEPIIRVTRESRKRNVPVITPMIGEKVDLQTENTFSNWWEKVV